MSFLELQNVSIGYAPQGREKSKPAAVEHLNLAVRQGELISLLGPSGCGKTTTMRAIAGLLPLRAGRVMLNDVDLTRVSANRRNIGLVFQSYALFPHLDVHENVAFGLRLRKVAPAALRERVAAVIHAVGLDGFEHRMPAQMSGGQQQRVALARAIVIEPALLLLDEPLSNLDAKLRVQMRVELRRIQRELGITMLYVTHDQEEALALSDRIVVMNAGKIEQLDTPDVVFNAPASRFVADFIGVDNMFGYRAGRLFSATGAALPFPDTVPSGVTHIGWRAQKVRVGEGEFSGTVLARAYQGDTVHYLIDSALGPVKGSADAKAAQWRETEAVHFALQAESAIFLRP